MTRRVPSARHRAGWTLVLAIAVGIVFIGAGPIVGAGRIERVDGPVVGGALAERGPSVQLFPPPPPPQLYPTGRCDDLAPGLPGLNGQFPTEIRRIGTSVRGRPIWAEYWGPAVPTATVLVVAQVHGNECSPTLVVEELRERPPTTTGVWLIPTLNPDGYAASERRNANDVDLNADGGRKSQPETAALMGFIAELRPVLTIYIHSPNGFVGAYASPGGGRASTMCRALAMRTAMKCPGSGAGARADRGTWFLWQGQPYGGESLLVELHAVSNAEVPTARPRPATRTVAQVRADAQALVTLIHSLD